MTEKEKKAAEEKVFRELCDYVKTEIMGYDENQSLSRSMILRLRGLKTGQYMANKNSPSMAHYPYKVILLTFKYVKQHELDSILKSKTFNNDQHKFNYVLKIIDNNINTVYNKVKKLKEEQHRADNIEVVELPNYTNQYAQQKVNKNLENFW
jgi:hypothetical protein